MGLYIIWVAIVVFVATLISLIANKVCRWAVAICVTILSPIVYEFPDGHPLGKLYHKSGENITPLPWGAWHYPFKGGAEGGFALLDSPTTEVRVGSGNTFMVVEATLTNPDSGVGNRQYAIWPVSGMISKRIDLLPLEMATRDKLTPFLKDADEVIEAGMNEGEVFESLTNRVNNLRPFGEDVHLKVLEVFRTGTSNTKTPTPSGAGVSLSNFSICLPYRAVLSSHAPLLQFVLYALL